MRDCPRGGLTPLAVLVLGLATERAMHPYEMLQVTLDRHEDRFVNVRAGSLYHTVDRLASLGFLRVVDVERAGNRPERTLYEVTEAGKSALHEHLVEILATPKREYPELYLALSEAHGLPREQVIDLLAERLSRMWATREELGQWRELAEAKDTAEAYFLDVGCRIAVIDAEISYVERVHKRLIGGELHWPGNGSFENEDNGGFANQLAPADKLPPLTTTVDQPLSKG